MDDKKLKKYAVDYLLARHKFLTETEKEDLLSGNDNLVGRIGEFIAINFLKRQGRLVTKNKNKVEKGYDLETNDKAKVSVKLITAENNRGRTNRVKNPWTEFVLITLNDKYKVDRIGHIKKNEILQAVKTGFLKTEEPYANRRMLKDNGLFEQYGRLYKDKDVIDYL